MGKMDVSGVEKITKVHKVKKASCTAALHDVVQISSEARKIEQWVELLKQMPDVREEKIAAASARPDPKKIAHALLKELC